MAKDQNQIQYTWTRCRRNPAGNWAEAPTTGIRETDMENETKKMSQQKNAPEDLPIPGKEADKVKGGGNYNPTNPCPPPKPGPVVDPGGGRPPDPGCPKGPDDGGHGSESVDR